MMQLVAFNRKFDEVSETDFLKIDSFFQQLYPKTFVDILISKIVHKEQQIHTDTDRYTKSSRYIQTDRDRRAWRQNNGRQKMEAGKLTNYCEKGITIYCNIFIYLCKCDNNPNINAQYSQLNTKIINTYTFFIRTEFIRT